VWHDSCVCVTWLLCVWDMTPVCVWYDSCVCVTWLLCVCDMTPVCVWHDSCVCVIWLLCVCDMTPVCVWYDPLTLENDVYVSNDVHVFMHTCAHQNGVVTPAWHESFITVAWLTQSSMCVAWLIVYVCGMPHLHVWHDPSECTVGWVTSRMKMISYLHTLQCTRMDECISTYMYGCIKNRNTRAAYRFTWISPHLSVCQPYVSPDVYVWQSPVPTIAFAFQTRVSSLIWGGFG